MTTARERYEAKTKVVTFRVHQGLYEDLKKIKTETSLSFTDLIKLGAGIARDEIEAKIAEENDWQGKLEKLGYAMLLKGYHSRPFQQRWPEPPANPHFSPAMVTRSVSKG